jgi:hypothetical protein
VTRSLLGVALCVGLAGAAQAAALDWSAASENDVIELRAEVVTGAALRERVDAVFAKKYPLSMWVAGLFGRHGGDNCLALSSR